MFTAFQLILVSNLAESEGFEPPDLLQSTVFKTAAIDHSAISPINRNHQPIASANLRTFFVFASLFRIKNKIIKPLFFNYFISFGLQNKKNIFQNIRLLARSFECTICLFIFSKFYIHIHFLYPCTNETKPNSGFSCQYSDKFKPVPGDFRIKRYE